MAKKGSAIQTALKFVAWFTGVVVSLAVGFGMVDGVLRIPYIQAIVPAVGYIVVFTTLVSVVLAILHK